MRGSRGSLRLAAIMMILLPALVMADARWPVIFDGNMVFQIDMKTSGWGDWQTWGDQGDGTYHNPVLPADYSDIDCIRVGPDYYAISSTFQFSPGMVILHSKRLS